MKNSPKAVIIGLDAATWTFIRPWIAEGGMPNLANLMKAGCPEPLQPVLPRPGPTAQVVTADEESAKVEERLQALGYLE